MTSSTSINLSELELPTTYEYLVYDLARIADDLTSKSLHQWQDMGLVRENDSFGLVVADPEAGGNYKQYWDQPLMLAGFAVGFGPEKDRYCLNALRKMRAAARTGYDTLYLAESRPDLFEDIVESQTDDPDNPFLWGDFPWGGAVFTGNDDDPYRLLVGVSGLTQYEDDAVASFVGRILRGKLVTLGQES